MKRAGLTVVLTVVVIILLGAVGYTAVRRNGSLFGSGVVKDSGSNISDYSAVFLTNGQVYFGKINSNTDTVVDLRDIYYLQVNQALQDTTTKTSPSPSESPNVVLVKLGDELHGPNDRMLINKSQVLFTESLKSDSKVVQAISNYKK